MTSDITQDIEATRFMASAPSAENAGLLKVIKYGNDKDTEIKIRDALAFGIPVLLVGWKPQLQVNFDVSDISQYRSPIEQTSSWQGRLRLRFPMHAR